jgi:hypothetical protein
LVQYLRGAPDRFRDPDLWLRLFEAAPDDRPGAAEQAELLASLAWRTLWRDFPEEVESPAARARRLREEYLAPPGEPTSEIARAFARALHVLLGHLDAYANEGFIRTATQWDNARRLAATVGYVPAPPASATTDVALIVPSEARVATVPRGLAMRFKPPAGPPIVFETLRDILVHPDLNAARVEGWDRNPTFLDSDGPLRFLGGGKDVAAGDVVVLAPASGTAPPALGAVVAAASKVGEIAEITLDRTVPAATWAKFNAVLLTRAGPPRRARARVTGTPGGVVVDTGGTARLGVGDVVAWATDAGFEFTVVLAVDGSRVVLDRTPPASGGRARLLLPSRVGRAAEGDFRVPLAVERLVTLRADRSIRILEEGREVPEEGQAVSRAFTAEPGDVAFLPPTASPGIDVRVIGEPPPIAVGLGLPGRTVEFEGAPPTGLEEGAYLAARAGGETIAALRVEGVRVEQDRHFVAFAAEPPADTLYYGPFGVALRPEDWNRSPAPALGPDGRTVVLSGLAPEAAALVESGRRVLIEDERASGRAPALAEVVATSPGAAAGTLAVELASGARLEGLAAGWTAFRLNTATASHGETRGSKTLGSGDAERPRQSFVLDEPELAFVPDPTAATGVRADLDIAVDGVLWRQAAATEPVAEGADAWHLARRDDGGCEVVFRRRLPTGRDNVSVRRRRVGVGPSGNAVPANGFTEPLKPHPAVAAIRQPLPPSGGAGPEPVERIRQQAPMHLKALDRAVSVGDFAILAARHAKVQAACAERRFGPGPADVVQVTVVPVDGGALTAVLERELRTFLAARSLPGMRVELSSFESVPIEITATVFVDPERYDPDSIREAALAALVARFSLAARGLGRPLFAAEILAALETVEGVETATATLRLAPGAPAPKRPLPPGTGPYAALHARPDQVIHLASSGLVGIRVEPPS